MEKNDSDTELLVNTSTMLVPSDKEDKELLVGSGKDYNDIE